ncbi:MAG: helix-turn-helix domain-containing protein [Streptosporangiales bacterium]|nr:helix-turn-helix domain-containing protein [Streptosporangiales bacterium]
MREHLTSPLTLGDLADAVGYSPFHLARLFRTTVGIPPGEFRTALRFHHAKRLLIGEGLSVTDTCFAVGFDSLGSFSSRFTSLVGVTPATFKRLPELVEGSTPTRPYVRGADRAFDGVVRGTVRTTRCSAIYVGLFPQAIAKSRPVAGAFLTTPGPFELLGVPPGTYRLLAAGQPPGADMIERLAPDAGTLVGAAPAPVVVRAGAEVVHQDVWLRPRYATEPPVLVALAALSMPQL